MKILAGAKIVGGRLQVHIDLKGGPGSGDTPGHPFRGNQWDGGGGGGSSDSGFDSDMSKVSEKEVVDWGGDRGFFGASAVSDCQSYMQASGIVQRDGGEVVGVASYKVLKVGKKIDVKNLATKRPGHGTKMMAEICRVAKDNESGVTLRSAEGAVKFYQKMGMTMQKFSAKEIYFKFTPEQAAAFSEAHGKKSMADDLLRLEPRNGVFAISGEEPKQ